MARRLPTPAGPGRAFRNALRTLWVLLPALLLLLDLRSPVAAREPDLLSTPFPPTLHPALVKRLLQARPDERIPILVGMEGPSPGEIAAAEMEDGRPLPERRARLVACLRARAEAAQAALLRRLQEAARRGDVEAIRPLWLSNQIAVRATPRGILALSQAPGIRQIREDRLRRWIAPSTAAEPEDPLSTPWNLAMIHAPEAWAAFGITGTGVVVANIDTGVDWLHPALQRAYRGYDPRGFHRHTGNWFDATGMGAAYPVDGNGHGTHTMGLMVGEGIGVAPGARWIAVRAFDAQGYALDSWIHAAFEWILAPNGNPALAPAILNNSWGNPNGGDTAFAEDLAALQAAGIFAVFSAGNSGPGPGSVGSPASLPGAFAVGAVDAEGQVAWFSSRGPSPWGEIRPHVVAPGVHIRSTLPGGTYGELSGTSMAAPHAAGVAALLKAARPDLSPLQIAEILTRTATPLTTTIPNNESGWGLVNAMEALSAAVESGILEGTVRDSEGAPIAGATLTAVSRDGTLRISRESDARGRYRFFLRPNTYDLTAVAFGYASQQVFGILITRGVTRTLDFQLDRLPRGTLIVHGADEQGGSVASPTLTLIGTPVSLTQPAFPFTLTVPAGRYTVRGRALGHRVATATVEVQASLTATIPLTMPRMPRVLLVDAGAWYSESTLPFYREALEARAWAYDEHRIVYPPAPPPTSTLGAYDVVIWSSPFDSPGYIGADGALTFFLKRGGRLVVSGQDVAFWDDGGSGVLYAPYLRELLGTRYVRDSTRIFTVTGTLDGPFAGIQTAIRGEGGAGNQIAPDEIAPADPFTDQPMDYLGDGGAATAVGLCRPHRGVVFAFGVEGIPDPEVRGELLERALQALQAPPRPWGLRWDPSLTERVVPTATQAIFTATLQNLSEVATDTIQLQLEGNSWPATITPAAMALSPCARGTVTLTVSVPEGLPRDAGAVITLTARSALSPSLAVPAIWHLKTPALLLLVEDDRWFDVGAPYRRALAASGLSFDRWRVTGLHGMGSPSEADLARYEGVIWFTGYDWFDPLSEEEETRLLRFLQRGGRLALFSQDYLYALRTYDRPWTFASVLGVRAHDEGLTATFGLPSPLLPIGRGFPRWTIQLPYPNWTDALEPTSDATPVWRGEHGRPIAVVRSEGPGQVFFSTLGLEGLPEPLQGEAMRRILSDLGPLGKTAMQVEFREGRWTVTVDVNVLRLGESVPATVSLQLTVPTTWTIQAPESSPEWAFDPALPGWRGILRAPRILTAAMTLEGPPGWVPLILEGTDGVWPLRRVEPVGLGVPAPSLFPVILSWNAPSGVPLTVPWEVHNESAVSLPLVLTATFPLSWQGIAFTATVGVSRQPFPGVGTWTGMLSAGETLRWLSVGSPRTLKDQLDRLTLRAEDAFGGVYEVEGWAWARPWQLYLPLTARAPPGP